MTIRVPSEAEYGAFLQVRIVRFSVIRHADFAARRTNVRFRRCTSARLGMAKGRLWTASAYFRDTGQSPESPALQPLALCAANGAIEPKLTHTVMNMDRSNTLKAFSLGSATKPDNTMPCFPPL